MARRRTPGSGSTFQDSHGQWWAKIPLPDGRTRRARCADRKGAEAALKALLVDRDDHRLDMNASQQSVKAWLESWLTAKMRTVAPRTFEFYERHANYAVPHIGTIRLEALQPHHVRTMLARVAVAGLSPRSCAHVLGVLHNALSMALRDRLVRENVAALVDKPRVIDYQAHVLSDQEVDRLLQAADGTRRVIRFGERIGELTHSEPERLQALIHMWIALGPRKMETLSLRWADYDQQRQLLTIADSKTVAGKRILPLPAALCDLLDSHWQQQQEERRVQGMKWKEHGLIFASAVGTPIGARNIQRLFKRVLADAGLPADIRIHDLRHTAATDLVAAGGDIKNVQAVMGHASVETTLKIYAKARADQARGTVDAADARRRKRG